MKPSEVLQVEPAQLPADDRRNLAVKILARYEKGESIYRLAEEIGVVHTTLYRMLLTEAEDEWRELQAARAEDALLKAEEALASAGDQVEISRTREQIRAAQWRLERLKRRLYGQDSQFANVPTVAIQININRDRDPPPIEREVG